VQCWPVASTILGSACVGDDGLRVDLPVYDVWIDTDDVTVHAEVGHGACDDLDGLSIDETETVVVVTAHARRSMDECPAEEVLSQLTAALGRPLGERRLRGYPAGDAP
jgi:hypothetical protein